MKKKILYSHLIGAIDGGSDHCLYSFLTQIDKSKYEPYLIYNKRNNFVNDLESLGISTISFVKQIPKNNSNSIIESNTKSKKNTNSQFRLFLSSLKILVKKVPDIIKYIKLIRKYKVDILHTNHNLNGDGAIIIAGLLLGKKIICHNRGLHNPVLIDKIISNYVNKIICVSDYSKNVYTTQGIKEEKCITIYDGVNIEKFIPQKTNNDFIKVGCIGRLEVWKGQQVLVDAAEQIISKNPKIKFILIGSGSNQTTLENQIKQKGLGNHFELTGGVSNVHNYMNKCDIIVHTSIVPEPFGMVVIEAMALEKPVIATNFGGPKEIIDNEIDGFLIKPSEPEILANKVIDLIERPDLRNEIGIKARNKILSKFNLQNTSEELQQIYETIYN